jgi:hypothetical protein
MKKLILLITLMVGTLAFGQEAVPYDMFGIWINGEGEALKISRDGSEVVFSRRSTTQILAAGYIKEVDGELHIVRYDKKDSYNLAYFVGKDNMVISKPRSQQAWIWYRIQ